jgi:FkbM family methyltransferase
MTSINFQALSAANCRHGFMVWPKADGTIGRALGLYGEFAEGENRLLSRYAETGSIVIDVGANLGTTVLPLARAVGPSGQVIAFEPQPLMAQCLHTNLTLNELFNVRVLTAAAADRSGWGRIPAPGIDEGGNYGAMALGEEGLQVPLITLGELDLPSCSLIKIDVEGFEWSVIQGCENLLSRHQPVLYLEAKRIAGTVAYLDYLMRKGWRCYWHFASFFRSDNYLRNQENIFGGTGDMNVLAVPADREQPENLPEIHNSADDWRDVYEIFYKERGIPMP